MISHRTLSRILAGLWKKTTKIKLSLQVCFFQHFCIFTCYSTDSLAEIIWFSKWASLLRKWAPRWKSKLCTIHSDFCQDRTLQFMLSRKALCPVKGEIWGLVMFFVIFQIIFLVLSVSNFTLFFHAKYTWYP